MDMTLPPDFVVAGMWLWKNFAKEIIKELASSARETLGKEWEKFEWSLAAKRYRERIYELYSTMRILGNPYPVPLEGIYTDLHVLDRPTAYRRHNIEQLKASHKKRKAEKPRPSYFSDDYMDELDNQTSNALALIRRRQRLFILGKPGAGKTTLLKYVTLLAAKGNINRVPIFISLNDFSQRSQGMMSQFDLMSYIVRQFEICSFPDAQLFIEEGLLKKGRAIVLFDGLDEVNEENQLRNQVTRILTDFTNQYADNAFIITCRVAATDYTFEKFPYVEIADFTEEQINLFVQKWFYSYPEKGQRFFKEIRQPQNEGLYELARTPILLSLLCLNFDETLTFPARRNEIYQEAIDALLKKWDSSRNIKRDEIYRGLSSLRKRQLLTRVAAEFFQQGEIFFTTSDIAQRIERYLVTLPEMQGQIIEGEVVLRAIEAQHGILVERARGVHTFSHLSLQEYFTSQFIVEYASEKMVEQLMEHLLSPSWHEVFLMVAGALPSADMFLGIFIREEKLIIEKMMSINKIRECFASESDQTPVQRLITLELITAYAHTRSKKYLVQDMNKILKSLLSTIEETESFDNIKVLCSVLSDKARSLPILERDSRLLGVVTTFFDQVEPIIEEDAEVDFCLKKARLMHNLMDTVLVDLKAVARWQPAIKSESIPMDTEKRELIEVLIKTQKNFEEILEGFDLINKHLNTDISSPKWYKAVRELISTDELPNYLYLNQLFLECINVSAVSDRNTLIAENFLQ